MRFLTLVAGICSVVAPVFKVDAQTGLGPPTAPFAPAAGSAGASTFPERPGVPIDEDGWSILEPAPDSRVVYVSSSTGDDSNSGLMEQSPKRTIAAGYALLRHGRPDWLLLKRGDVFPEPLGHWRKAGRSAGEPIVVSAYGGAGSRPLLRTGTACGFERSGGGGSPADISHVVVAGLAFEADGYDGTNGTPVGFFWLGPGANILIEDCKFSGYFTGVTVQGDANGRVANLALRRSAVVDCYGNAGHSQGVFLSGVDGVLIEESLLDHNGWKEGVSEPDIFKHNIYVTSYNSGVIVRGNVIARGSSHGLQLRCGGVVENNLFVRNPLAMFVAGGEGVRSVVRRNVVTEGVDIAPGIYRGYGIETLDTYDALVEGNIIANTLVGHQHGIALSASSSPETAAATSRYRANFVNNIVYNWRGTCFDVSSPDSQVYDDIRFESNSVSALTGGLMVLFTPPQIDPARFRFAANAYFSSALPNGWFYYGVGTVPYLTWVVSTADAGSQILRPMFTDPNRTPAAYQSTLGRAATFDDFVSQVRAQSRRNWKIEYRAAAFNDYVRAGFTESSERRPCPADLNCDTLVNFGDVMMFQDAYAAGNPMADINNDGLLSIGDFTAFQQYFAAGCR